jgi:membrane-bound lytic murein transglycosylase D
LLVEETARYVFRILAVKEIMTNPKNYGFNYREKDLYPPYKTYVVKVDSSISDLATFAFENDINYKILKYLNPWLRDTYINNKNGKTYEIKLPAKGFEDLIPVDTVFEIADSVLVDSIAN